MKNYHKRNSECDPSRKSSNISSSGFR
nr:hypothetical protein B11C_120013 [Bartonella sp. 1-1C]